jgi:CO/xanthine dehydrogenase FAD-binding subunit
MSVTVPTSLDDVLAALAADPSATILAGGTDLMVEVNDGARRPSSVLAIRRVPELRGWHIAPDVITIGAGTTYTDLLSPELSTALPALAAAARTVGSPQIRTAGTVGGNVATASPAGDTLPVLAALDATVHLATRAGTRSLPLEDFIVGPKRVDLHPGELITSITVPAVRGPQEYMKVGVRNAMVIAVASLALVVDLERRRVGIGLGSVGPTPLLAPTARAWIGDRLLWRADGVGLRDPADVERFGELVADAARPIDDHRSTAVYRRQAVAILARRALRRALRWAP